MKTLKKHIEVGKYSFDIVVNRDIATSAMDFVPELSAYIFEQAKLAVNNKTNKVPDEFDILYAAAKKGEINQMSKREEQVAECVRLAFPKMLKAAGENLNANEIIDYIYENGVDEEFNAGVYEMILLGFFQREVSSKKVNFSMK